MLLSHCSLRWLSALVWCSLASLYQRECDCWHWNETKNSLMKSSKQSHLHYIFFCRTTLWNNRAWTCRAPPLKIIQKRRTVSSHLGQRAFRKFTRDRSCSAHIHAVSCSVEALLLTCSLTDKFIPTVWKQMGPFIWRFPLTNRGRSTALMPGRAQGSGCLDLRSSSAPLSAPTLLHLLSLVGNWRQTCVGELRAPWQEARSERMGLRCLHLHGSSGQSHRGWWPDREQRDYGVHRCPQRHAMLCSALNLTVFQPLLWGSNGCSVNTATELP